MKAAILKPGYLVSLKSTIRGGVLYERVDLEPDHRDDDGARVARWETKRRIEDPEEYERATECRSRARAMIAAVCSASNFGLLCPSSRDGELVAAIAAARAVTAAFNQGAARSRVEVYVLVGRIAADDAEAARAIASEVRELISDMKAGIKAADVERIREAASKARELEGMLSTDVALSVTQAIDEARRAARIIAKRVGKAGEQVAEVVAELTTAKIDAARFAVLDLEGGEVGEGEAPAGRGVDLEGRGPTLAESDAVTAAIGYPPLNAPRALTLDLAAESEALGLEGMQE